MSALQERSLSVPGPQGHDIEVALTEGGAGQPLLFLSDGERRLWALKKQYLPEAIGILDLWHVMEYLWKGAHVFHHDPAPISA